MKRFMLLAALVLLLGAATAPDDEIWASEVAPSKVATEPAPENVEEPMPPEETASLQETQVDLPLKEDVQAPLAWGGGCSEVCTTFFAPNHGDCNDLACYSRGCGAPNGWNPSTCMCSCSFCL